MSRKNSDKPEEEKTYEVKDKRRVNPDGSLKQEAAETESAPEPQQQPTETAEKAEESKTAEAQARERAQAPGPEAELPPPNIFETLQFVTGLLAEQAWQLMGIHLPPGRKEPVVDMAQAKIAIDTVISIVDRIHPHIDEESRRALRGIISDLQINFVQHSK